MFIYYIRCDYAFRPSVRAFVGPLVRAMFVKSVEICGLKQSEYSESPGKGEQLSLFPCPVGCAMCIRPCFFRKCLAKWNKRERIDAFKPFALTCDYHVEGTKSSSGLWNLCNLVLISSSRVYFQTYSMAQINCNLLKPLYHNVKHNFKNYRPNWWFRKNWNDGA